MRVHRIPYCWLLGIVALLGAGGSAVWSLVPAAPVYPADPLPWTRRWLAGIPCRAPCWEGITPGQTTAEEAIVLLRGNPAIQAASVMSYTATARYSSIDWRWARGQQGGSVHYDPQPPHTITYVAARYPVSFSLQDIRDAYGEPSHVIAAAYPGGFPGERTSTTPDYMLRLVYQAQGFSVVDPTQDSKPVLDDASLFIIPTFFDPDAPLPYPLTPPQELVPWQGMHSFEYYCRDEHKGAFCRAAVLPNYTLPSALGLVGAGICVRCWWRWRRNHTP